MLKLERNQMKKESRMTTNAAAWSDDDEDGSKTPQLMLMLSPSGM
jgi:hypothetical protein